MWWPLPVSVAQGSPLLWCQNAISVSFLWRYPVVTPMGMVSMRFGGANHTFQSAIWTRLLRRMEFDNSAFEMVDIAGGDLDGDGSGVSFCCLTTMGAVTSVSMQMDRTSVKKSLNGWLVGRSMMDHGPSVQETSMGISKWKSWRSGMANGGLVWPTWLHSRHHGY